MATLITLACVVHSSPRCHSSRLLSPGQSCAVTFVTTTLIINIIIVIYIILLPVMFLNPPWLFLVLLILWTLVQLMNQRVREERGVDHHSRLLCFFPHSYCAASSSRIFSFHLRHRLGLKSYRLAPSGNTSFKCIHIPLPLNLLERLMLQVWQDPDIYTSS